MRQIYPDLWITEPEHPFPDEVPDLAMHAYVLMRPAGNLLFCRSEHAADHRQISELGGVTHHYLTHWHEAAPGLARIKERFGSRLCCHRLVLDRVTPYSAVDEAFDRREIQLGDIEVLPTPGHTPGSTCFVFRSPLGKTYLFAGDTLFPSRGTWQAATFEDGDKGQLRESLGLLRALEPDVVLFGATVADDPVKTLSRAEWQSAVDTAARSLS